MSSGPFTVLISAADVPAYSLFDFCSIKDEITADRLGEADLVIFGGPRDLFSVAEFKELKDWLNNGGRALVLLGDGGEKVTGCNLNYLLEEYVFLLLHLICVTLCAHVTCVDVDSV